MSWWFGERGARLRLRYPPLVEELGFRGLGFPGLKGYPPLLESCWCGLGLVLVLVRSW